MAPRWSHLARAAIIKVGESDGARDSNVARFAAPNQLSILKKSFFGRTGKHFSQQTRSDICVDGEAGASWVNSHLPSLRSQPSTSPIGSSSCPKIKMIHASLRSYPATLFCKVATA